MLDMRSLLQEIVTLHGAANVQYGLSNPVPAPPASEADLARLDAYFAGHALTTPPSLREALAVHNGVEHLYGEDFGLLSVERIVTDEVRPRLTPEARKKFAKGVKIIIGGGPTHEFMGLDLKSKPGADGEIGIVTVTIDLHAARAASLRAFLEQLHTTLRENA
jgi:hypothetical protein